MDHPIRAKSDTELFDAKVSEIKDLITTLGENDSYGIEDRLAALEEIEAHASDLHENVESNAASASEDE